MAGQIAEGDVVGGGSIENGGLAGPVTGYQAQSGSHRTCRAEAGKGHPLTVHAHRARSGPGRPEQQVRDVLEAAAQ